METLYQHCDHGCDHHLSANLEEGAFAKVQQAFEKAIAFLHGKKTFRPEFLTNESVKGYISETYNVLKKAVQTGIKHEVPAKMMNRLNSGVFVFSGMKVFTALKEAQLSLTDEKGQVKTWDRFKADAKAIDGKYNENYLRAERRYAVDAARAASDWNRFWEDKDLFDLEYLTDNGPNVRNSHRALEHTVLPMEASFWNSYFPPNGWNCHCKVVRVPKGDKPHSDNTAALDKGKEATSALDKNGNNSAAIFRFNPGKQQVIFPEKHPYYPQHCNGEKLNLSGWMGLGKWLLDAEGERCKAKKIVEDIFQAQKKERKAKNQELTSWSHGIIKKGHHLTFTGNQFTSEVRVSRSNLESIIKHIADPENKEIVKSIEDVVTGSKFIKQAKLGEGVKKSSKNIGRKKARGVTHYRYYQTVWNGNNVEINMEVMKDGYEQPYSIDFIKK